ncbi:hypothetical protein YPPY45_1997, partial [Yersinia pestis PY-45]|jgi:hypothetical protein
MKIY